MYKETSSELSLVVVSWFGVVAVDQEKSVKHSALDHLFRKRTLCRVCYGRLSLVYIGWDDHRDVILRGLVGDSRREKNCAIDPNKSFYRKCR